MWQRSLREPNTLITPSAQQPRSGSRYGWSQLAASGGGGGGRSRLLGALVSVEAKTSSWFGLGLGLGLG